MERKIMKINEQQFELLDDLLTRLIKVPNGFYAKKFAGMSVKNQKDFEALPFTSKEELRDLYPLGLAAVPEEKIVRIHSSSGTTGTPIIIPYTQKDIDDWADMFKRCYEIAGITEMDRIQVTPGYGLWTAGIGFQLGAEKLGAMVVPMGPGNVEKQIQMLIDMKSTVWTSTSSFALLLAEEIDRRGVKEKINLKKGVIGSERWGEKMRKRIANELGVKLYDIYGLTEIYGPGIGISCEHEKGMHCFDDYLYFEIIDPQSGEILPDGEMGELVITTLRKEGAPLIRYRTHDLTRILPGNCECGLPYTRIDTLLGRTDDMVKVKGVNIYPQQLEDVLKTIDGVSSEYQVMIDHLNGKDIMTVYFEMSEDANKYDTEERVRHGIKSGIGLTVVPKAVELGDLPRSEKKTTRIYDNRY
jgi:phenylacetate-CoA ligase